MRKRYKILLGIAATLLITWAIVTAYYYNQHVVTTKSITIDGWDFDREGSEGLHFKEINLVNKTGNIEGMILSDSLIKFLNKVPTNKLQMMVYKIIKFYSNPYVKNENGWRLTLSGVVVKDSFENDISWKAPINISVEYSNCEKIRLIDGVSTVSSSNSNIVYLGARRNDVDPSLVPAKISWYWDKDYVFELELDNVAFKTNKNGFFDYRPIEREKFFSFREETIEVYRNIKKGKKIQSELIKDIDVLAQFETMRKYPNGITHFDFPTYIGNYKGHANVFAMNIQYQYIKRDNYDTADLYQTLYFIEQDGKWKLIDTETTDS